MFNFLIVVFFDNCLLCKFSSIYSHALNRLTTATLRWRTRRINAGLINLSKCV